MTFREALHDLLARKVNGITSKRALARRLYELQPGNATNEESWRRQVQAWTSADPPEPEEKSIRLVADAFGVSRSELPVARPGWTRRVEELEREVAELTAAIQQIRGQRPGGANRGTLPSHGE